MKKALLLIAAAMFVLAGCQKEQTEQETKSNNIIHIGVKQLAPTTRVVADATDLADLSAEAVNFKWEEGDQVLFLSTDFLEQNIYTCSNPSTGEFELAEGNGLVSDNSYYAFYPPSGINAMNPSVAYEEYYRVNQIPKEHVITCGNAETGMPNYVNGSDTEFTLNLHTAIIHIILKGTAKIGHIDYIVGEDVTSTLNFKEAVQLSDTPIDVYLDATFVNIGFKLEFFDESGNSLDSKETLFDMKNYQYNTIIDFKEPITVNAKAE